MLTCIIAFDSDVSFYLSYSAFLINAGGLFNILLFYDVAACFMLAAASENQVKNDIYLFQMSIELRIEMFNFYYRLLNDLND